MPNTKSRTYTKRVHFNVTSSGGHQAASSTDYYRSGSVGEFRVDEGGLRDWRKRIREHREATTRLSGEKSENWLYPASGGYTVNVHGLTSGGWKWDPKVVSYKGLPSGDYFPFPPSLSVITDNVAGQIAANKFNKQIEELNTQFQGGVFLGELKEAWQMIKSPGKALFQSLERDYYRALKKRKSNKKDLANALFSEYLAWVFGAKPLMNDIAQGFDAMDYLANKHDNSFVKILTGVGRQAKHTMLSPSSYGYTKFISFIGDKQVSQQQKVKYRGLYERDTTKPDHLSQMGYASRVLGLDIEHFIPTLYQLAPWSFLADYFANIGDVLEFTFMNTSNVNWVVRTQIDTAISYEKVRLNQPWLQYMYADRNTYRDLVIDEGKPAVILGRRRYFTRVPSLVPSVNLEFSLPGRPQPWLNMAALVGMFGTIHPQRRIKYDRDSRWSRF